MEVNIKKVHSGHLQVFKLILLRILISIMKSKDLKIISKTFFKKVNHQIPSRIF